MARGKNTQNFLVKRKRPTKGAKGTNGSNEALDTVIMDTYNKIEKGYGDFTLKIYNSYNKTLMYVGLGAFLLIFLILNFVEKKIIKYTYSYENISEIKYKSVYNGHYNYIGQESYETLTAMGPEGRKIYLYYNIILIFVYSPFLTYSITNLISEVCGYTKTNIIPVFISIFQILESVTLIFTIMRYPNSLTLLYMAGKLAIVKYFFIFVTIFVVIFGFIDRYQGKPKPTGVEEVEADKDKANKDKKKSN